MKATAKNKPSALELSQSSHARASRLKHLTGPASLLLGGGLLFVIAAAVCFWQSWLVVGGFTGVAAMERYTLSEAQALGRFAEDTRARIVQAVNSDAVTAALAAGGDGAQDAARAAL